MLCLISPLAGKPAPADMLINVDELLQPVLHPASRPQNPLQRVSFGTSGHRGTAAKAHASTKIIFLPSRRPSSSTGTAQGIAGPLYIGMDTHALSAPAQRSALEVLAAHGVEVFHGAERGFTPTPVISHAILTYNEAAQAAWPMAS